MSRYLSKPSIAHWEALKWVLRYVKGTTNFGLTYGKRTNDSYHVIRGYTDVDFGKYLDYKKII